ncbi:MAG: GspE/PulE family protein, partial [Bacteroidota bacterium]
ISRAFFLAMVEVHQRETAELDRLLLTHYHREQGEHTPATKGTTQAMPNGEGSDVVQFVQKIMREAAEMKASDIHVERYENQARIRFRWEGQLLEKYEVPADQYNAIISRIKIMAELDISERRLPQDGRINMRHDGHSIDIRVSTIPGKYGEKAVLRLLTRSQEHLQLSKLGLSEAEESAYLQAAKSPNGIVLITGPTGSGKTTTLYATLNLLNQPDKNILTIEDPIEYNLGGINQVQLKEEIGLTFDRALRAFLRQDPDIIMVGEIRDHDTAQIAIRAALTGHLVLSTLHTNSAWDAITRLVDMGVEPYLLAAALRLVVAQRLVRILCPHCKQSVDTQPYPELQQTHQITHHYQPVGCPRCNYTGHQGRKAVFEILPINKILGKAIKNGSEAPPDAQSQLPSLQNNLLGMLKNGEISLEEMVLHVGSGISG